MKKLPVFLIIAALLLCASALADSVALDAAHFPDAAFRAYLADTFDEDGDAVLSEAEVANVTSVVFRFTSEAHSVKGIEYFPNLTTLNLSEDANITEVDVSHNPHLQVLNLSRTGVSVVDVSHNPELVQLALTRSQVTSVDVSHNPLLEELWVNSTAISALDVRNCPALTRIMCNNTAITSLDLSRQTQLQTLYIQSTGITSLDLSHNSALDWLVCDYDILKTIDLNWIPNLTFLSIENLNAYGLDLTPLTRLTRFTYYIPEIELKMTGATYDLSTLPGLDVQRVLTWDLGTDGAVSGQTLTIPSSRIVRYVYDCGNGQQLDYQLNFILNGQQPEDRMVLITRPAATYLDAGITVYINMYTFRSLRGAQDAEGNACPEYVSILNDTLYQLSNSYGFSAKELYDNNLAPGAPYEEYQTSYLYVRAGDIQGEEALPGDADGDGHVAMSDVVAILAYLNGGGEIDLSNASLTGGDGVSVADAVELLRMLCE